jgi:tetratricopeptide (TPR) repeat protein
MGNVLYSIEGYQKALAAYEQAIQLEPAHADAHHNKRFTIHKNSLALQVQDELVDREKNSYLVIPPININKGAIETG